MRPATASRLARLAAALLVVGLVLTACVQHGRAGLDVRAAAVSASAAASGSAAPSGSAAASGSVAPSASVAPSGSAAPSGSVRSVGPRVLGPASAPPSGAAGGSLKISATNTKYDTDALEAKAGQAFQIVFTNNDAGVMHNVQITAADGSKPFSGALVTGPASATYDVPRPVGRCLHVQLRRPSDDDRDADRQVAP